ncbi:transcriptional regulator, AraC family [Opitutus terrae PB90-1]|uniref:Transcriptional regulator, AraC family n=2 Tax=Opitutus terrae TaxID=107709 RepID=B1ZS33_OPITP|nr:transcriptional regulator, AraC family [Opitutus terrae PB90-1]
MSSQVAEARRFYVERTSDGGPGPFVVGGGWERCAVDYEIRRAGFPHVTLEFVAGGRGDLQMNGRSHALTRGCVFAYGPGIAHAITTDPADRLSKYFVNFSGRGAAAVMRSAGLTLGECHAVAAVDEVQAAFEQLLFAGRRGTRTGARIAALQGQILLLLVSEVRLPNAQRSNPSLATFLRCQRFLEEHFLAVSTAEEAAAACRVAPAYLSRLFQRFAGQPPYRFLMRLKMHHAATLLEEKQLIVREAADVLGMDPFHFSRAFKRVHGLSPLAFLRSRSTG